MNIADLTRAAREFEEYVVSYRRVLHKQPELRWREDKTLHVITETALPLSTEKHAEKWLRRYYKGGLVIDYTVDPTLPRVLFRADVDALPIVEQTGLPFASQNPGVMHACGHDVHAAMLLGAIMAIRSKAVQPTRNLRFVFQRAEENPGTDPNPVSGGDMLVQEGVLEGISRAHMLHIWASGDPGVFYSRAGAFLGNSGRLCMMIKATGGHAAMPHNGSNALRVALAISTALDSFAARHLSPLEPVALEPVILKSGTGSNVMPAEAELWYGCRTMLPRGQHAKFQDAIEEEVRAIVGRFPGASVAFTKILGHPALINDEADYNRVRCVLEGAGEKVEVHPQLLGGEDFAYYLYGVKGSAWMLGANQEGCGDHHMPTFNPDESVFWKGVLFWLLLATTQETT